MGKRKRGNKEAPSGEHQLPKRPKTGEKLTPAEAMAAKMRRLAQAALQKKDLFVENVTNDDRKEEGALYDLLGSMDAQDRMDAAMCVISRLLGGDGVPVAILERHLDRRLLRGLASGRNASRIGFSLVITEILCQLYGEKNLAAEQYPALRFERVLQMLVDRTEPQPNISGQEQADNYYGRLFGLEAFVKAQTPREPTRWFALLDLIMALAGKKVWIRSQCGYLIVQAIEQIDKDTARQTLEKLAGTQLAHTPEGVAAWIAVTERFPDVLVEPWGDPFAGKKLNRLSQVLREQSHADPNDPDPKPQVKQANWTAQLPFVWSLIVTHLVSASEDEFATFWQTVIDDGFFSKNASEGQKYRGFLIIQQTLQAFVAKGSLPLTIFSPKLMSSLMNQVAKEDRYLHRAALKALKAVEAAVGENPDFVLAALKGLLGPNGDFAFDLRTHTKTVDRIVGRIKPDEEKKVVKFLRKQLVASLGEEQGATGRVRTYIDYLARVVQSLSDATHTSSAALGELCELAYATPEDIPEAALTEQTRAVCRKRLEAVFAKLITKAEDFGTLSKAVSAIDPKSMNMGKDLKAQLKATLKRTKALAKQHDSTNSTTAVMPALSLLYAVAILQLYNQDPDALNTINDLDSFYDQLTTAQDVEAGSGFLVETLLSLVVRPSSLMRQVSQKVFEVFSGHLNEDALRLLTDPLARDENIKGQAELFDTADGDEEGDEEEGEDSDEADVEEDGDGEENDGEDENEDEESDDDNEDGDDNEDEDGIDDGQGLTIKGSLDIEDPEGLDNALENLLKTRRLDRAAAAQGGDADSDEDADMSDSEMLALDDKISAAFKLRTKHLAKTTKKDHRDARETVANFKHRILDLLDVYVRARPADPLVFDVVLLPVLRLVRTTSTRAVANRAAEILQTLFKGVRKARQQLPPQSEGQEDSKKEGDDKKDDSPPPPAAPETGKLLGSLDPDALLSLLGEIHIEATLDLSHTFARAASSASLVVVSAMHALDERSVEAAATLYATTQASWVLGEVRLQPAFFTDWLNWCQSHANKPRER